MCLIKKRNLMLSVISAALLATCWGAQAAYDTANLTITATVVANTCTLKTTKVTADLKRISARDLTGAGIEKGNTPFSLELTNCSAGTTGVTIEATGKKISNSPELFESTGSATGVGIKIMGGDHKVNLAKEDAKYDVKGKSTNAQLNFTASLVQANATVTPGSVDSSISLAVSYD
ncbi:fimbrial protein [Rouxiella sp. T17]|uniref:fimbrial protein n=1 Tax=Rouxiella sp. T17 TaxID=3085684 RepID=UPI002FC648C5